jgi:hypothetical protein
MSYFRISFLAYDLQRTTQGYSLRPLAAPLAHGLEDGGQRAAFVGEAVLDPGRDLGVEGAGQDAFFLERRELLGEGFGRDVGEIFPSSLKRLVP